MKTSDTPRPALLGWLALTLTLLLSGACVPQNMVVSPLGTVVVGSGEDIQIRSLEVITGSIGELGIPRQRVVAMALADYGPIKGHKVSMGAGLDSLCTAEGGKAAAETAVGDHRVVGVIGTSCSVAAAAASPILSEAGLVMISSSNTAPSLTSTCGARPGPTTMPAITGYRATTSTRHRRSRNLCITNWACTEWPRSMTAIPTQPGLRPRSRRVRSLGRRGDRG